MVYSQQDGYYQAIEQSTACGNCSPFIDFMLGEIHNSLLQVAAAPTVIPPLSDTESFIAEYLRQAPKATARELAELKNISPRQIEKHLDNMKKKGLILRVGARRNGEWKVLIPSDKA